MSDKQSPLARVLTTLATLTSGGAALHISPSAAMAAAGGAWLLSNVIALALADTNDVQPEPESLSGVDQYPEGQLPTT